MVEKLDFIRLALAIDMHNRSHVARLELGLRQGSGKNNHVVFGDH